MLRTAMLISALLMVRSLSAVAGDVIEYVWDPAPAVTGQLIPCASLTIEAGEQVSYIFRTEDWDTRTKKVDGVPVNAVAENFIGVVGSRSVQSCQNGGTCTAVSYPPPARTYADWLQYGSAPGPLEAEATAYDTWYADDQGILPQQPADGTHSGSTDDAMAGPCIMTVTITPNCGWIYGTVSGPGGPIGYITVKLYVGTQYLREVPADGSGHYVFRYVAAGNYTVKATTPMGKTGQAGATVTKGNGTQANITINP